MSPIQVLRELSRTDQIQMDVIRGYLRRAMNKNLESISKVYVGFTVVFNLILSE